MAVQSQVSSQLQSTTSLLAAPAQVVGGEEGCWGLEAALGAQ